MANCNECLYRLRRKARQPKQDRSLSVVAETWDGYLNDINEFHEIWIGSATSTWRRMERQIFTRNIGTQQIYALNVRWSK